MLYTCGSAIPAAVSVNKELFYGTVDGIQALVCTFGMPVVCKTSNRRGDTPPAAYARAHGLGLVPLVRPRGADHAVGHAKLQRRWALDFLALPLLPVFRCPARAALPGGTRGREAGADTERHFTVYLGLWLERGIHSLPTATLSRSGSGAAAPTGLLPPLLGPPLRGPLTPVSLVQREYHLPLPLAGYQSLCVCSQLCASAPCF